MKPQLYHKCSIFGLFYSFILSIMKFNSDTYDTDLDLF